MHIQSPDLLTCCAPSCVPTPTVRCFSRSQCDPSSCAEGDAPNPVVRTASDLLLHLTHEILTISLRLRSDRWVYFNAVEFEWCDNPTESQIAWQIYAALAYGAKVS